MQFNDTTRKGSWHSLLFEELPSGNYQLMSHGPIIVPEKPGTSSRTTFNSMRAGITGHKELQHFKHEYDKMHKPRPKLPEPHKDNGQPKPTTPANLHQHQKHFDWPSKMFRHKKKCSKCLAIKDKLYKSTEKIYAKLQKKSK